MQPCLFPSYMPILNIWFVIAEPLFDSIRFWNNWNYIKCFVFLLFYFPGQVYKEPDTKCSATDAALVHSQCRKCCSSFIFCLPVYWKWPGKTFHCCFHFTRYDGRSALPLLCTFCTKAVLDGKSSALMREVTLSRGEIPPSHTGLLNHHNCTDISPTYFFDSLWCFGFIFERSRFCAACFCYFSLKDFKRMLKYRLFPLTLF